MKGLVKRVRVTVPCFYFPLYTQETNLPAHAMLVHTWIYQRVAKYPILPTAYDQKDPLIFDMMIIAI